MRVVARAGGGHSGDQSSNGLRAAARADITSTVVAPRAPEGGQRIALKDLVGSEPIAAPNQDSIRVGHSGI